jgi:hypothetical protein
MFSMCFGCFTQEQQKNPQILIQQATIKEIETTIPKPQINNPISYKSEQKKADQSQTKTDSSAAAFEQFAYTLLAESARNSNHYHHTEYNDISHSRTGNISYYSEENSHQGNYHHHTSDHNDNSHPTIGDTSCYSYSAE